MPFDTIAEEYWNDIKNAVYGQSQLRRVMEAGSLGEFAFTFGANYCDKFTSSLTFGSAATLTEGW